MSLDPASARDAGSGGRWFTTTHWSVVLAAHGAAPGAREALEALCRTYWCPIYAYVRRHGCPPEEAQDLTQDFFARFVANESFGQADPGQVPHLPAHLAQELPRQRVASGIARETRRLASASSRWTLMAPSNPTRPSLWTT